MQAPSISPAPLPMDFELARFNMIEQQIRPWEVLDPDVLELLKQVRREEFVPPRYRDLAFADMNIPLGEGEVMMQPKVEARLLQALAVERDDRVLEIGTGSGYMTALLASLARHVDSVEIRPAFAEDAARKLDDHGIGNVHIDVGDGAREWHTGQEYACIALTGSVPLLPDAFRKSLTEGGRLVAIVGQAPVMEAVLVTRVDEFSWHTESLFDTSLPALLNAAAPPRFTF